MLARKKTDMIMTNGRLSGIFISGSFLLRVCFFAFLAISSIRIPVAPPDMTPPIPRMNVKLVMWRNSARK